MDLHLSHRQYPLSTQLCAWPWAKWLTRNRIYDSILGLEDPWDMGEGGWERGDWEVDGAIRSC